MLGFAQESTIKSQKFQHKLEYFSSTSANYRGYAIHTNFILYLYILVCQLLILLVPVYFCFTSETQWHAELWKWIYSMSNTTIIWVPYKCFLPLLTSNAAFTCYRNYRKYELPSRKLDMNSLREALCGQFPTRKLVFTIIPIARECSINPQENHKCNPQAEQPQGFVNQSSTSWSKSIIFATGEIHFIKSF